MTAGDIVKESLLVVEEFTVKANEDIEEGEIVWNDGNGILAAASTDKGPFFMALEDHDYSEETTHGVRCVVSGFVEAQKKADQAVKKGQLVSISGTAGEVRVFDYATPDNWYDAVGVCVEDAAASDTTVKILIGKR